MLFGVLGPVEISAANGVYSLERSMRRAVLAFLLLNAGRVVSLDQLEDALWGGAQPATARALMHSSMSRIRQVLRAAGCTDLLATRPGGYLLTLEPGQLDLEVFDEHVGRARAAAADGRHSAAAEAFRAALGLWRGPALGGASAAYVPAARQHLEDRRILTYEDLVDSELARGRHTELTTELGGLVEANPLRERLTGQLMLALYRCGRQADALAAFHQLRVRLVEQLGIDPGREIRERHEAILRADPSLDLNAPIAAAAQQTQQTRPVPPVVVPRQLPPAVPFFVGRSAELAALAALADRTAEPGGAVAIAAIEGTAGVGKTALALQWAHLVAGRFPDGQLYVNMRGFDPADSPMRPAEAVRVFLDALGIPPDRIPATAQAQVGLYRSLLTNRRVLLLLDNARDAAQVRPLLPGSSTCLVIVTSRNRLGSLVAAEGATPLTLDLLSRADAEHLLALRLGDKRIASDPMAVEEVIARCARLPLALAILAARAAAHPDFPLADLAKELLEVRRRLDGFDTGDAATNVRTVLSWSHQQLSPPAAELFRLLSLHSGPDIGLSAAASLAGLDVDTARATLGELTRCNMLAEPALGRFAFHDLLRAYAAELVSTCETPATRRAATARLLDHYLHTAHAGDRLLGRSRDPIALSPPQPGVRIDHLTDNLRARAWFAAEHAALVATIRHCESDLHICQLAWAMADYLDLRGHWRDLADTQRAALTAATRLALRPEQARAACALGSALSRLGCYEEARTHLGKALELYRSLADPIGGAHAHLHVTSMLERQGRHAEALEHARQALELAREARHPKWCARALNAVGWYHAQLGQYSQALDHCRQALVLQNDMGDRDGAADTWDSIGYAHHHLGSHEQAIDCYRQAGDLWRETGNRRGQADTLVNLGETLVAMKRPEAARDAWLQALAILEELDLPDAERVRACLRELETRLSDGCLSDLDLLSS